ncbi:hypothetical protein RJT34_32684 [Clitoria ternatea]|uniref:Uncharacterized protein n=1 Tax=Clitoria ternatea TaxID=43366 RepID=A0AAN9F4G5_CLITE
METIWVQKQAEETIVSSFNETQNEGGDGGGRHFEKEQGQDQSMFNIKSFLWHGGSSSALDITIFFFSTGNAIRNLTVYILWTLGRLDSISN